MSTADEVLMRQAERMARMSQWSGLMGDVVRDMTREWTYRTYCKTLPRHEKDVEALRSVADHVKSSMTERIRRARWDSMKIEIDTTI